MHATLEAPFLRPRPTGQRLGLAGREKLNPFDAPFARRDRQSAGKIFRLSLLLR
jgi:hypothetical protein